MIDTDKYEGLSRFDLVEQHNIHELAIFLLDQLAEVKRLREAFITAVRHVGEHDLSRDDLFSKLDEDLFSLWLFRSE